MKEFRRILVAVPLLVLAVCLVGLYATRGVMDHLSYLGGGAGELVDQRPWQTAAALAPMAVSAEEVASAREAERLADHEVDQAFALALRQAAAEQRVLTGPALALSEKVAGLKQTVAEDQRLVDVAATGGGTRGPRRGAKSDSLPTDSGVSEPASVVSAGGAELEVAKAQLGLDSDELADATQELARASGDKRGAIQQELSAREAAMKRYDDRSGGDGQTSVISAQRYGTLAGRVSSWFREKERAWLIRQARQEAEQEAQALSRQLTELERTPGMGSTGSEVAMPIERSSGVPRAAENGTSRALADGAHRLSEQRGILADRVDTVRQLVAVYARWEGQVELEHRIVQHLILESLAWIAVIVLCGAGLARLGHRLLDRQGMDRRRVATLDTVLDLAMQALAFLGILLVIFGPPNQVPTILGLATAGLTVVFQDFILAFFGWFVLMGKQGIRVGDWVEINGIGGEVVEIGVFRTALLETGNWTGRGHPTGRRTTFVNKFAVSGQYFNFSTHGQWMWDEIRVSLPAGANIVETTEQIQRTIAQETAKDSGQAEEEWQRAARLNGVGHFRAAPSVDLRPTATGVDVILRYVTRAGDRFEVRNRLYGAVLGILQKAGETRQTTPERT